MSKSSLTYVYISRWPSVCIIHMNNWVDATAMEQQDTCLHFMVCGAEIHNKHSLQGLAVTHRFIQITSPSIPSRHYSLDLHYEWGCLESQEVRALCWRLISMKYHKTFILKYMPKSELCKMGHLYFNGQSRHNNSNKILVWQLSD
jgi:hypothetical protein